VIVSPNARDDTIRRAHSHVGEMATIDPAVKRSATVRAGEATVVARVSEAAFTKVANSYPFLWRRMALELAERLRQRADAVAARAETPRVFIASSSEALGMARALKADLIKSKLDVKIWTDGIFTPGITNIEALEKELKVADFAAVILSDDDKVFSRWRLKRAPRDNLILELGLFMGAIGRQRAIMIHPRSRKVKLPTDLLGVTPISYNNSDMAGVAKSMQSLIASLGPK
jgi:CRP/FNR family transcriptional regulator, cyclic AMP receptor protein